MKAHSLTSLKIISIPPTPPVDIGLAVSLALILGIFLGAGMTLAFMFVRRRKVADQIKVVPQVPDVSSPSEILRDLRVDGSSAESAYNMAFNISKALKKKSARAEEQDLSLDISIGKKSGDPDVAITYVAKFPNIS